MQDLSGEALISFYGRQWARYTESLRLINRLLQYLNRCKLFCMLLTGQAYH